MCKEGGGVGGIFLNVIFLQFYFISLIDTLTVILTCVSLLANPQRRVLRLHILYGALLGLGLGGGEAPPEKGLPGLLGRE